MFRFSSRLIAKDGFEVRATLPSKPERDLIIERVAGALELIERHAPLRYADLRRDLPRILVGGSHGMGECHDAVGLCLLKFDYIVREGTDAASVALTLVHEGMHARLNRAGFPYNEKVRTQIERICAKAELLLATRIGGTVAGADYAEERLAWTDEKWSDEYAASRRRTLEEIGWDGRLAYRLTGQWQRLRRLLNRRAA